MRYGVGNGEMGKEKKDFMGERIGKFEDLVVWQEGMQLAGRVTEV